MEIIIAVLVGVVFVLLAARTLVTTVTVFEYQRGLKFVEGRFTGLLDPGRYWLWLASQEIRPVDTRESILPVPGQEVVSSDGVSVKLSLAVRYRVADPVVAIIHVENYHGATYLILQVALREVVAELTIDEILERRQSIGPSVHERCVESTAELGVELLSVQVKDLMFPRAAEEGLRTGHRGAPAGARCRREGAWRNRGAPRPGECRTPGGCESRAPPPPDASAAFGIVRQYADRRTATRFDARPGEWAAGDGPPARDSRRATRRACRGLGRAVLPGRKRPLRGPDSHGVTVTRARRARNVHSPG